MFTPEERLVYRCPRTGRFYDPLAVKAALVSAGYSPSAPREKTLLAARKALSLPPIDPETGKGILDAIVWEALCDFTAYLRGKGKRANATQPVSPSTDCHEAAPTNSGSP